MPFGVIREEPKSEHKQKNQIQLPILPKVIEAINEINPIDEKNITYDSIEVYRALLNLMGYRKNADMVKLKKEQTRDKVIHELSDRSKLSILLKNISEILDYNSLI